MARTRANERSKRQLDAAIELSRRPGVGAARFKELVDLHGSPAAALATMPCQLDLAGLGGKPPLDVERIAALDAVGGDIGFTVYGATDYPRLLARTTEPPPYLFHKGTLWPSPEVAVAIVGPRRCTSEGAAFACGLAAGLARHGVPVVSGGALGVDTAAHRGALDAGGTTVLVTATGIGRVYPRENERLFRDVAARGCIVTELLPGTPPRRDFFPTRNRIIVGLSAAVVIVEGRLRTGTWSSASHALRQKRIVFCWTGSPDRSLRELPDVLLGKGAIAMSGPDAELVIERIASP